MSEELEEKHPSGNDRPPTRFTLNTYLIRFEIIIWVKMFHFRGQSARAKGQTTKKAAVFAATRQTIAFRRAMYLLLDSLTSHRRRPIGITNNFHVRSDGGWPRAVFRRLLRGRAFFSHSNRERKTRPKLIHSRHHSMSIGVHQFVLRERRAHLISAFFPCSEVKNDRFEFRNAK